MHGERKLQFNIEGEVSQESPSLPLLLDPGRFSLLFNDHYNGSFIRAKGKVIVDNKETRIIATRQKLLEMEEDIIERQLLSLGRESLPGLRLQECAPLLYQTWQEILDYFRRQKTLPSLASWGDEMVQHMRRYVCAYLNHLQAIPLGKSLRPDARIK